MKRWMMMVLTVGLILGSALAAEAAGKGKRKGDRDGSGPRRKRDATCKIVTHEQAAPHEVKRARNRQRRQDDGCKGSVDEDGDGVCDTCRAKGECDGSGDGPKAPQGGPYGDGDCDGDGPHEPRRGRG